MLHLIGNQQIIKKRKKQSTKQKKQTKNNKHIQKPKKFQNNGTNFKARED